MKYEVTRQDDATQISVSGDVDLETSGELRQVLLDGVAHARALRLDMSEVRVIDSSGVAALIEAFQAARKKGKTFTLLQVPQSVMRVLKLAKLDGVFEIESQL